jgi:hypothetical protein
MKVWREKKVQKRILYSAPSERNIITQENGAENILSFGSTDRELASVMLSDIKYSPPSINKQKSILILTEKMLSEDLPGRLWVLLAFCRFCSFISNHFCFAELLPLQSHK